jgi:hypothetical protein
MADEHPLSDLTQLGGAIAEMARDLRLLRVQVEHIAARLAAHEQRLTALDARSALIERSTPQQLSRFDAVDAALTAIREWLLANQRMLIELVGRKG